MQSCFSWHLDSWVVKKGQCQGQHKSTGNGSTNLVPFCLKVYQSCLSGSLEVGWWPVRPLQGRGKMSIMFPKSLHLLTGNWKLDKCCKKACVFVMPKSAPGNNECFCRVCFVCFCDLRGCFVWSILKTTTSIGQGYTFSMATKWLHAPGCTVGNFTFH